MKVKELKSILEHLNGDLEVNFAIVSNKKDNKTVEWIPFGATMSVFGLKISKHESQRIKTYIGAS